MFVKVENSNALIVTVKVWNVQGRSSHQRCSIQKGVLKDFAKFTGKHLRQSLFFNKVAGLRHRGFRVNFVKFFKDNFFIEHV